jgi:hypothetical protein
MAKTQNSPGGNMAGKGFVRQLAVITLSFAAAQVGAATTPLPQIVRAAVQTSEVVTVANENAA